MEGYHSGMKSTLLDDARIERRSLCYLLRKLVEELEPHYLRLEALKQNGFITNQHLEHTYRKVALQAACIPDSFVRVHSSQRLAAVASLTKRGVVYDIVMPNTPWSSCNCQQGQRGIMCAHQVRVTMAMQQCDAAAAARSMADGGVGAATRKPGLSAHYVALAQQTAAAAAAAASIAAGGAAPSAAEAQVGTSSNPAAAGGEVQGDDPDGAVQEVVSAASMGIALDAIWRTKTLPSRRQLPPRRNTAPGVAASVAPPAAVPHNALRLLAGRQSPSLGASTPQPTARPSAHSSSSEGSRAASTASGGGTAAAGAAVAASAVRDDLSGDAVALRPTVSVALVACC